ncbi:MAG: response regulator transcription factor [bacterium]
MKKTKSSAKTKKPQKKRILLVEDHPMTRMGIKLMIAGEAGLEVCGEAGDAGQALDAAIELHPDLVLTDVSLPGRSGFELVQDLQARCPEIPVLILSMHSETSYARRALEIGARGYIMKSEHSEKVLEAIQTILRGRIYVSEAIAGQLLEFLSHRSKNKQSGPDALSPREFEVFKLLGEGVSTQDIARRLNLSPKTVETHRAHIKDKLHATSAAHLVAMAADWIARQSMAESPSPDTLH